MRRAERDGALGRDRFHLDRQRVDDRRDRVRNHPVVDPPAATFPLEQAGVMEHFQVMTDCRLGQPERLDRLAGAHVSTPSDQREQLQTSGIRQRSQLSGQGCGLVMGERRFEDRGAAGRHRDILTDPDIGATYRQMSIEGKTIMSDLTMSDCCGDDGCCCDDCC